MNVLLISPKWKSAYSSLNIFLPPLGLMYIAGMLRQNGHNVRIIDENIEPIDYDEFKEYDLVGISSDTCRYPEAVSLAKEAKKRGKIVVMGGFHTTFLDDDAIKTGFVDCVVRGEGEEIMVQIAEALEDGRTFNDIPAITYKEKSKIIRNPGLGIVENIDKLPYPARDLIKIDQYPTTVAGKKATSVLTSRGCPFNCSFCAVTKFSGIKWRARSAKSIVDEIQTILKKGWAKAIVFVDDNFTLSVKRVKEICRLIKERALKFPWWCMSRVDTLVKNPDMVEEMASAGCKTVFLGLESGNEDTLEDFNKKISTNTSEKAVNLLRKFGITPYGSFIIGALGETKESILKTIEFSKKLKLGISQFSILTPFPGTDLFNSIKERIVERDWSKFDALHLVFKHDKLSRKQVHKLLVKAYASFYSQPRIIFRFFKDILKGNFKFLSGLKIFFRFLKAGIIRLFYPSKID